MKARLIKFWETLRSSYWFIPTLMALAAVALSFVTTTIDGVVGATWLDQVDWLYANQPDGARALLSTIAGSMIGVAGVTFSITIAAVAYATSQFGPRLLTNFMRDQGNQLTLGTFTATFLYCLLVLRTIRSAEEAPAAGTPVEDLVGAFVPHIAILVGVAFALASIGVFIYFIHHIPESIHASNVVAGIGGELNERIDTLFPERIGYGAPSDEDYDPTEDVPENFFEEAAPVRADGTGYVQYLDDRRLLQSAVAHDLLLRVEYRPGDFISRGKPLVYAWPEKHLSEEVAAKIRGAFVWGRQRTQRQDTVFLAHELVEIAGRALSPGTNDPFTAMTCMDWLGSALENLARRDLPGAHRYDEEGTLRLIARPLSFADFTDAIFPQLRPYAEDDRNAALHLMKVIGEVAQAVDSEEQRAVLRGHAEDLKDGAEEMLGHPEDRAALEQRYRTVLKLLQDRARHRTLSDANMWLGGSG